jgi:NDP-sugar pyrophosphorylase family protein
VRENLAMRAVILAGGKGTRLRPYTTEIPKPLVPVGDRPIIEILLLCLKKHGVTRVTVAVNHLEHMIRAVLGDGRRFDIAIDYSSEDTPLSTMAPLALIRDLPDNFLVINGDVITDLDFGRLYEGHLASRAGLTVAVHRRVHKVDYGVVETDAAGHAIGFREKPEYVFTVSMGVYVLARRLLTFLPKDRPFGFDDLMLTLLKEKETVRTFPFDGYWLDVGRPDDYEIANNDLDFIRKLYQ